MASIATIETHSEDETRLLGADIGATAEAGDIILLHGTFGVGKTTLVQGMARGLGVKENVNSPSFTIANEYRGRIPLYHVDLYRVEEMDPTTLEALAEYFGGDGLCVVEWPASLPAALEHEADRVELSVTGETDRKLTLLTDRPRLRAIFERRPRAKRLHAQPAARRGPVAPLPAADGAEPVKGQRRAKA